MVEGQGTDRVQVEMVPGGTFEVLVNGLLLHPDTHHLLHQQLRGLQVRLADGLEQACPLSEAGILLVPKLCVGVGESESERAGCGAGVPCLAGRHVHLRRPARWKLHGSKVPFPLDQNEVSSDFNFCLALRTESMRVERKRDVLLPM